MEAFSAQCEGPAAAQQAVLIRLLDTHRGVDLLQRHGVEVPSDLVAADVGAGTATAATGTAAVQLLRQLPLTSYSDYEPLIEDAIAAGRAFTADDPATAESWDAAIEKLSGSKPVWAFYLSSGTTGSQKRLPASMMSVGASMKVGMVGWGSGGLVCVCGCGWVAKRRPTLYCSARCPLCMCTPTVTPP